MKYVLAALYLIMLGLSGLAMWLSPSAGADRLVWVTDSNPVRNEQMELFRRLSPRYDIMIDPDNFGKQKVMVQSLAGVGPDMFDIPGYQLADFAEAGIAMDLTPIVALADVADPSPRSFADSPYYRFLHQRNLADWRAAHSEQEPDAEVEDECRERAVRHALEVARAIDPELLWPIARSEVTVGDRMYAYPCNIWSLMVAYHRDLFDKAGVAYPEPDWTWEDFLRIAKELTVRDPQSGRITQYGLLEFYSPLNAAYMQGAELFNETGTRCTIYSDEAIEAYRFGLDLRDKHHVMPTASEQAGMSSEGGWGSGSVNLFAAKKGAMLVFGRWARINWRLINQQAIERGQDPPLHIDFAPQPKGRRRYYFGGCRICVVNAKSPRRFEALDFLAYLAGEEYGRQINWSADCIPGPIRWSQTPEQLTSPEFPEEAASDVYWRDQASSVYPLPRSPFVPFARRDEIIRYHEDRMGARLCSVEQGLRDMQTDIDRAIAEHVRDNPHLAARYEEACRRQDLLDARVEEAAHGTD